MMHVTCSNSEWFFFDQTQKQISINDFYILWIIIVRMGLLQHNTIMKSSAKMCEAGILRKYTFFQIGSFFLLVDWFLSLFAFLSNDPVKEIQWQFHLLNETLKIGKLNQLIAQENKIIVSWTEEISERYMGFIQPMLNYCFNIVV